MTENKNFEINDQALENAAGGSSSYKQMEFGSFGYVACNYVVDPYTGRTGVGNPGYRG